MIFVLPHKERNSNEPCFPIKYIAYLLLYFLLTYLSRCLRWMEKRFSILLLDNVEHLSSFLFEPVLSSTEDPDQPVLTYFLKSAYHGTSIWKPVSDAYCCYDNLLTGDHFPDCTWVRVRARRFSGQVIFTLASEQCRRPRARASYWSE